MKNLKIKEEGIKFLTEVFKIENPRNYGIRMENNDVILLGTGRKKEEYEIDKDSYDVKEEIMFEKYLFGEISWHQYSEWMKENEEKTVVAGFTVLHLCQEDADTFRKSIIRKDKYGTSKKSKNSSPKTKEGRGHNSSSNENTGDQTDQKESA